ncbi:MAG: APC family permease [Bdellovibrionales bacterium]|nr:APC family permease [Bdellovibrionales bacterium]
MSGTGEQQKLGEWQATAICGNDITSSCLYVSALSLMWAGALGPVVLVCVAAVLFLFRGIYTEVLSALPLNGGAYNALLNTTSKQRASFAACLTLLSYFATAVISASEAVHYGLSIYTSFGGSTPSGQVLYWCTIALLGAFALLTTRGIGESANVALVIFIFHMVTLSILVIACLAYLFSHGTDIFYANLSAEPPRDSSSPLLFGFAVALLGISGFESSANFVEEQKEGVFPKTLRNMWVAVSFFNPAICLLALGIVPLAMVAAHREALLAHLGHLAGGSWLGTLVSFDASIVLSGAVLTSFVGTTGLVHRMSLDRCLPQLLLKKSRFNTFHRIIFLFFILCATLLAVAKDLEGLAGVYTISFLSVMALFAIGNILLKLKRDRLPRSVRVSWLTLVLAIIAVLIGLGANIALNPHNFQIFLFYFVPTIALVSVMLHGTTLLKGLLFASNVMTQKIGHFSRTTTEWIHSKIEQIHSQQMVFFTRGDNISNLNQAVLYVMDNEHTNRLRVVTVVKDRSEVPESIKQDINFLDRAYPEVVITFEVIEGDFTPELLRNLSDKWNIPLNFMFIGSPGDHFPHRLAELGGVRLII